MTAVTENVENQSALRATQSRAVLLAKYVSWALTAAFLLLVGNGIPCTTPALVVSRKNRSTGDGIGTANARSAGLVFDNKPVTRIRPARSPSGNGVLAISEILV